MAYHIIVKGTPVSINSSSRSKSAWKSKIAHMASPEFSTPLRHNDLRVQITIFYNGVYTYDPNNMSKPVCDAMCNVAYIDDNQIMEPIVRMRSLDGAYKIKGIPRKVAIALSEGEDFSINVIC
jgi:crossover junction endodeoxyribonuclease RusA